MKITDLDYSVQFFFHEETQGMRVTTTDFKIMEDTLTFDSDKPVDQLKIGDRIYLAGTPEYKYQIKAISIIEIGDKLKRFGISSNTSQHVGDFKPYIFTVDIELKLI